MTFRTMTGRTMTGALTAMTVIAPAFAQSAGPAGHTPQDEYQRGYAATPMPDQAAINAGGAAGTAALNDRAGDAQAAQASSAAANRAQYDADRAAYLDALARHDRAVDRTDARYRRQQNAYADAMAVWRVQVMECRKGHTRACNMPPPNPADFY